MLYVWRDANARFSALCVASISMGLILVSIISFRLNVHLHIVSSYFLFYGGIILMISNLSRWIAFRCRRCFYERVEHLDSVNCKSMRVCKMLRMRSNVFNILSISAFVLSIISAAFATKVGFSVK